MSEKSMPDIENILAGLGEDDIQALKAAAESIFGNEGEQKPAHISAEMSDFGDLLNNAELLGKIGTIMSAMNKTDGRSNLIAALKPLLSEPRRKKADEALQMLRLLEVMPLLQKEFGNGGFFE